MPQNIMIGTVDGDIFYVHDGRVPIRNHGLPTNRPVPGNVSKNDFAGIHRVRGSGAGHESHGGYMQNCNVAPVHMMHDSPMTKEMRQAAVPVLRRRARQPSAGRDGDRDSARRRSRSRSTKRSIWRSARRCSAPTNGKSGWPGPGNRPPMRPRRPTPRRSYDNIQQWNRRSRSRVNRCAVVLCIQDGARGKDARKPSPCPPI